MKKLISIVLIMTCFLFSTSCSLVPAYDYDDVEDILEEKRYEISDIDDGSYEGMNGFIHGVKENTEDEIYYAYFKDISSAKAFYNYVNNKQKAKISELKMEIEKIDYLLHKAEGVTAAEKGKHYEKYVELSEVLDEIERYTCGRALNVVWYGTKQAIMDLRLGGQSK